MGLEGMGGGGVVRGRQVGDEWEEGGREVGERWEGGGMEVGERLEGSGGRWEGREMKKVGNVKGH